MPWWVTLVIATGAVIAIDRLLATMERRGWIYYRHSPPKRATAGHALQSIEALFRPEVHHVVEQRAAIGADDDDAGEPPDASSCASAGDVRSGGDDEGEPA